jgi:hypothetical protein
MEESLTNEQPVFEQVQILERNIEPSKQNEPLLNRNIQLGKIDKKEFAIIGQRLSKAMELRFFPEAHGCGIPNKHGLEEFKKLEAIMTLSGSKDGFVRTINQTSINKTDIKQNQGGILGKLFAPKQ